MKRLWALVVIGIAYTCWLYGQGSVTGVERTDGIFGVVLGLYICSHPAAHFVEILFFRRGNSGRASSRSLAYRLGLDMLVMFVGWMTVFVGTMHLIGSAR